MGGGAGAQATVTVCATLSGRAPASHTLCTFTFEDPICASDARPGFYPGARIPTTTPPRPATPGFVARDVPMVEVRAVEVRPARTGSPAERNFRGFPMAPSTTTPTAPPPPTPSPDSSSDEDAREDRTPADLAGGTPSHGMMPGANTDSSAVVDRVLLVGMGPSSRALVGAMAGRRLEPGGRRLEVAATTAGVSMPGLLGKVQPDLVLVGPSNEADTHRTVRQVRNVPGPRRVLALLPSAEPERALEALRAGADDVLPPPHSVSAILLRTLLLTSSSWSPVTAGGGHGGAVVKVDTGSRQMTSGKESRTLTGREYQLLEPLFLARGEVVDRQTLLDCIWGDAAGTEAVLDATVHRLRKKLEFDPAQPDILTTVRGVGYRVDSNRLLLDPHPARIHA
ncbi:MAG: hypothetical protein EA352_09400 [Gemmatimonadales bacterium]|nr:MAG: hypothetical protein EA352_09400 [Gemmatimonadales bacterium]